MQRTADGTVFAQFYAAKHGGTRKVEVFACIGDPKTPVDKNSDWYINFFVYNFRKSACICARQRV